MNSIGTALWQEEVDFRSDGAQLPPMQDDAPLDRTTLFSAAELASEFSLTTQGLRFYEEKGLIAPVRVGKTRIYSYRERARLLLIQKLRRLGFSIDQIREYLSLYRSDGSGAAQFRLGLERIASRIRELEQKKRDIDEALAELRALERDAQERLAGAATPAAKHRQPERARKQS